MKNSAEKIRKNRWAMAFLFASLALLLFGILAQVLCEAMGYDRHLFKYLMGLVPTVFVFFLLYCAVILYPDTVTVFRFLLSVLLGAMILWTVIAEFAIAEVHLQKDQTIMLDSYTEINPKVDVMYMFQSSRLFGEGDKYYIYPENTAENYLKAVFGEYRMHRMLPALSYHYGLWIDWLFAVITVLWCSIAAIVSFQVYRWWEKVTYLVCYVIIALQLILPLLGAFGIINDWGSHPFSANWLWNMTLVAPQLGIMFALVKTSRPSPPMLMEPGDDFWYEINDDE